MAYVSGNRADHINGGWNCALRRDYPLDSRLPIKLGSFRDHRLGEKFVETLVCCARLFWLRKTSHESSARTNIALWVRREVWRNCAFGEVVEMRAGKASE